MLFYSILFILFRIFFSEPNCKQGFNNCSKCNPITKLCVKCEKDIYAPDTDGGCENSKKCVLGTNHCIECLENEKLCKKCDEGYFPDENGGCSITDNCEISYKGECLKCKENYVLIGNMNTYSYITGKNKLCKPYSSDDLKNCKTINLEKGKCDTCEDGYYLGGGDKKCTKTEFCSISSFGVCQRCNNAYYLDKKQNKCILENNNFMNCKISNDGTKCDECKDDYYFDDEGKCVYSNFCSKGDNYKCDKCKEGYYLTQYGGTCTTEENCYNGRKDIGVCISCKDDYCIDFKDGKCKSNKENNDFQYCRVAEGKCTQWLYGYYLAQEDQRCSNSSNCLKSENGICTQCINGYFLTLDKRCITVEHCIYTDSYYNCIECENNFYYDRIDRKCKTAEGDFKNCKLGYKTCERCKDNFYLNNKDNLCYSNQENDEFYKCAISDNNGEHCSECIDGYNIGSMDYKCTKAEYCSIIENEERCLVCEDTYCLDSKNGSCVDNDFINDLDKIFYFRCNKTNKDSTACEVCIEGSELKDGLCIDNEHCSEKNADGTWKRCNKFKDENYEQCLNNIFGCVEAYFDPNCLECNDLNDVGYCTKCIDGYELDKYKKCSEIDS